uniref:Uncharacterized protein n=1 Tax=Pseudonaja textilis TaxID=8673 RepID=A0A670ZBM9_PSETE
MSSLVLLFIKLDIPNSCNHSTYVLASSPLIIVVALLCTLSRVQVREIDAELPSQVEEDEEGPRQPFAKDAVGAGGGRLGNVCVCAF